MTGTLTQYEQHTVQIQRVGTQVLNTHIYPSLDDAYRAARLILLDADEITSITQLNKITREINKAVTATLTPAWAGATDDMNAFAVYEASYYANLITQTTDAMLTTPADEQIQRYINRSLMSLQSGQRVDTGTWAQFVNNSVESVVSDYDNAVRTSFAQGETVGQASNRIKQLTDGVITREAEALARTGMQHYAVQARQAMAAQNKKVIIAEIPNTVFDNRRSLVCSGIQDEYGEKGWPVGKSPIGYPPYHYYCRTGILHLVEGEDSLEGRRTATGGKSGEAAEEAYELRKSRKRTSGKVKRRGRKDDAFFDPEQVNSTTPTDKWLERQPRWFVESSLGKTRAKLFLDGGMSLKSFTDMTNRPLTIDQLRELDARAFSEAGL